MVNGVGINGPDIQGFMTNENTFVGRIAAMKIAEEAGQLLGEPVTKELFSEDVWAGKAPTEDANYFFTLMKRLKSDGTTWVEVKPDPTEVLHNE